MICLTLAILILAASPIFGALKERRILLFSNGYQMPKVSVLSLQTFVTRDVAHLHPVFFLMFVCLRSGHSSPVMQGAWKPSPETLPLQQRKEAGTSRWQFSPAVLKRDKFSARFFCLPLLTPLHSLGFGLKMTEDRRDESHPSVLSRRSYT